VYDLAEGRAESRCVAELLPRSPFLCIGSLVVVGRPVENKAFSPV
jgi:hypothetical protein